MLESALLVKKSTEHHASAVRLSVTSRTISQIGSETQTQGDLKEPKEKDFCVQVEMLPRPVMVDAGVQTDPEPSPPCYGMKGSKVDTQHDHTYPRCQKVRRKIIKRKKVSISEPDHTKEELVGANPPNHSTPFKTAPVCDDVENLDAPKEKSEQCSELDDYESNDPHDASFHCSDLSYASDEEEATDESVPHPSQERKFIVFESSLDQLIAKIKCPVCGKPQSNLKKTLVGSMVKVHTECLDDHTILNWNSQPLLGRMPSGNLLCSAATLFSGETFQHMKNFADFLRLEFIGKTTFFEIQREILLPVVDTAFKSHIKKVREELNGTETWLSGDGRFDSPGFCAKYGLYTMMGQTTNKIAATQLVHVSEAGSSVACEKIGFIRCPEELEDEKFTVDLIATDRHLSIAKYMRQRKKEKYDFDLWHITKSVKKKLFKKMKRKDCTGLADWTKTITIHLWWSAKTCGGDAKKLKES